MTAAPLSRRRTLGAAAGLGLSLPTLAACAGSSDTESSTPVATDRPSEDPPGSNDAADPEEPVASNETMVGDVPVGGGVILDEVVITQPTEGDFRGFSPTCTHQGCKVREVTETIDCFCHGAKYSLETGEPVSGPANNPLSPRDLVVEGERIALA